MRRTPALTDNDGYALLLIILAGLVGGVLWNLLTWLLGLPSSSSHALFGGLIGSTIAALGFSGVNWNGDGTKLDGVDRQGDPAGADVAGDRRRRRRGRHLADLPGHRGRGRAVHRDRLPLGPDRQRLAGLAGPRHQRRPEDDGRDHAGADRERALERHRRGAALGQGRLRARDRRRHLARRLADHPHARQGPGRDLLAPGHGRRELLGRGHPRLEPPRLRAVDHPRRHRLDPRQRRRASPAPRCAGGSPAGWCWPGCSPCPPPGWSAR